MAHDARARDAIHALDRLTTQRFADQERALNAALASAEKAVLKAEAASEKRFEAVNEFRGTLSDQAATLMPRNEADARFKSIEDKLAVVTDQTKAAVARGTGASNLWGWIVGALGALAIIAALVTSFARFAA